MQTFAIETIELSKSFPGGVDAVRGLDVAIAPGTVYGLVGRNGAGKTTALRLMMGLLRPSAGQSRVLGAELAKAPQAHRARVAYVPQGQSLHKAMTLGELGLYVSHFYPDWDGDFASRLAKRFELPEDRPIGALSGGQQRKAAMILAFAARPEVLLLDEPAAGLDPVARRQFIDAVIELLSDWEEGCTVLLSTHILADLERLATRIGFLEKGRLAREADLDDLKERFRRVQVIFEGGAPPADFRLPGAIRQRAEGPVVAGVVEMANPQTLEALRAIPGTRVNEFPISLEDLTIELLGPLENGPHEDVEKERGR